MREGRNGPVTTDGNLGVRAASSNIRQKRGHITDVALAGAAGKEVIRQRCRIVNTLQRVLPEIVAVETGFEAGAKRALFSSVPVHESMESGGKGRTTLPSSVEPRA